MLNWSIHARYERKDWAMKLDAIGIVCENLKQSIAFYRMLGLPFGELEGDHIEFQISGLEKSSRQATGQGKNLGMLIGANAMLRCWILMEIQSIFLRLFNHRKDCI